MFSLSPVSEFRLRTCHPFIQQASLRVLERMDYAVTCGSRTEGEQDAAFARGVSKLRSNDPRAKHVVGAYRKLSDAIDVTPYYPDPPHTRYPDHRVRALSLAAGDRKLIRVEYVAGCKEWAQFARLADAFMHEARIISQHNPEWGGWRLRWGGDWDGDYLLSDNVFDDLPHLEIVRP